VSTISSRLDAVASVTAIAGDMLRILKDANVRNERLIVLVKKLHHEFAKHEHDLEHILARKGDREDREKPKAIEVDPEEFRRMLLEDGVSSEEIDSLLGNAAPEKSGHEEE
jgi:hypothetical protein